MSRSVQTTTTRGIVIVTGAARGVGRATVLALVRDHGCTVLAVSRDAAALSSLEKEAASERGGVEVLVQDVGAADAALHVKEAVKGRRVLAVVHNAALLHNKTMGGHERDELMRLFVVNTIAPLELTQALVGELAGDPPGHVVHIGSMGGSQDSSKFPGLVAYSASKAALACMAQCLAEEFKEVGIRSNCLALGAVNTEMLRSAFPGYQAPVEAGAVGAYVADFALNGHKLFNGKVLPLALSTP
jgi:3-oxoacyl-[acyl-carrier protein] reductase